MKRIVRILLGKATDSLLLSIEFFNRPFERGRSHASLILLDHSFEMLLKASLLHKGARIYDRKTEQTVGFDKCVRLAIGDGDVRFLTDEQTLTLQMINNMRDAEQHYFIDISENQHYLLMQAGVTLFKDILKNVFEKEISEYMPERVLPISTLPPRDIDVLFDYEIEQIKGMLALGCRKKTLALAKLRGLDIMENAISGESAPTAETKLRKKLTRIQEGENWQKVFPGVASINITSEGVGPSIDLRFTKKEGIPIHAVPEGTAGAPAVGIKKVNELSYYSLGRNDLAKKVGLTGPKTGAVIWFGKVKEDSGCYERIKIGKVCFDRYSPTAISKIKEILKENSIEDIWTKYRRRKK